MSERYPYNADEAPLVELLDGEGNPLVEPLGPIQFRLVELLEEVKTPLVEPLGPIMINNRDADAPLVELIDEKPETDK